MLILSIFGRRLVELWRCGISIDGRECDAMQCACNWTWWGYLDCLLTRTFLCETTILSSIWDLLLDQDKTSD